MTEPTVLIVLASADRRGAEVEGLQLAAELSARGVVATAVACAPAAAGSAAPLEVQVLGARPLSLGSLRALRRLARGVDVVVALGSSTLPACALALLGSRTPFVYRSIGDPARWVRGGWHRRRTGVLFRRAAHVIALWPGAAASIHELYGVSTDAITCIPNARPAAKTTPPSRASARSAFGLPAERHAVRTGEHPAIITRKNCDTFRRQIQRLGLSYDWDREIDTTDPNYYKWTQWIFTVLFERGLAYEVEAPVNWCPALGTVLANEEVKDGRYVETGDPVERRLMRQWMLRITAYAERLLEDLEGLDWPEGIKAMQREWIGRSEGADVEFTVAETGDRFTVFRLRKLYEAVFERPLMKDTFRRLVVPNLESTGEYGTDFGRPAEIYRRTERSRLTPKAWATLTGPD